MRKEFVYPLMGLVSFAAVLLSTNSEAATIGEARETRNQVTGELGTVVRDISIGNDVSADETVRTGENSAALLRFLDDTSLNIGAVSTVVLDSFVYDPNRGVDDAAFSLTKGALRFIGSGRARAVKATISTPVGIIGIRGTDLLVMCVQGPTCSAQLLEGRVRICPVPDGVPVNQQVLRDACIAGNANVLPCGFYEIAAEDEQNDDESNFTIIEPNCLTSTPPNVDNAVLRRLARQLAAGAALPNPSELPKLASSGPIPPGAIIVTGAGLFALPILLDDPDPVSD